MKWIPQISLRSLFALFFCAAVGLTVGTIESAVATAVAIGLIQQVRQLLGWSPCANESLSELAFARRFAIAWRLSAAAMTSTLLIAYMFASRGLLQFPDHDDVWYYWQEQTVLAFCVILAFCNSIARWQSDSPTGTMRWRPVVALWTIGILVGFVAIIDGTTTQFLIHKAVAGVEAAIPQQFQRPEVYPNLGDERYLTLWLAFAAVVSVLAAGALLVQRSKTAVSWRSLTTTNSLYALLLVAPGMFCYWYYTAEYHRLSPDIAGAGLAANWVNWLLGAFVAVALVTAGAYRLSKGGYAKAVVTDNLSHDLERTAFHESGFCLSIIGLYAGFTIAVTIVLVATHTSLSGRTPPVWSYVSMLCNPMMLLFLAYPIAILQFGWIRWRRRSEAVAWQLVGLSRGAFFANWIALMLLLIVVVPTLNAFAFILWLGPFDLLPLVGL